MRDRGRQLAMSGDDKRNKLVSLELPVWLEIKTTKPDHFLPAEVGGWRQYVFDPRRVKLASAATSGGLCRFGLTLCSNRIVKKRPEADIPAEGPIASVFASYT